MAFDTENNAGGPNAEKQSKEQAAVKRAEAERKGSGKK